MAIEVFNRYENKYLIDGNLYQKLVTDLSRKMKVDRHNIDGKMYPIFNTYYDTADHHIIRTSLEKPTYKEKVRIRSYQKNKKNDDIVYLEVKKKYDGLVNKRRTAMTLREAKQFLAGESVSFGPHANLQVVSELSEIVKRDKLYPKLELNYKRMAFFDKKDNNLRVSFDSGICVKWLDDKHKKVEQLLLPSNQYLMEVKVRWAMPLWLTEIISKYQLLPISFSKYGKEYVNKLKRSPAICGAKHRPAPCEAMVLRLREKVKYV